MLGGAGHHDEPARESYRIFLPPLTSLPAGRSFFVGFAARIRVMLSLLIVSSALEREMCVSTDYRLRPPLTSFFAGRSFFDAMVSSSRVSRCIWRVRASNPASWFPALAPWPAGSIVGVSASDKRHVVIRRELARTRVA